MALNLFGTKIEVPGLVEDKTLDYLLIQVAKRSSERKILDDFFAQGEGGILTKLDPENDGKEESCFDIKSTHAFIKDAHLYLAAEFYNSPSQLRDAVHTVCIKALG